MERSNEREGSCWHFADRRRTRVRTGSKCAEGEQGRRAEGRENHQRRPSQDAI
jgi:hypothetical protein